MSYVALVRREPRVLAFGFLQSTAATIGQTFVISLFLPFIKAEIGLGDAQLASFFTLTTLASAVVLSIVGRWIDSADLVRYSVLSAAVLVAGCVVGAVATSASTFVLALFALRLGGNGLLNHIALTSVARYFTSDRGKALSLVSSGFSVGEAGLGVLVVFVLAQWGRVGGFMAVAAIAAAFATSAIALVRANARFRRPEHVPLAADTPHAPPRPRHIATSPSFFVMSAPLFLVTPLVVTGLVFHQAVLAAAKGQTLQWFAVSFVAFAASRVAASLVVGPAIDRYGPNVLFALHVLPLSAGVAVLAAGSGAWIVPTYWVLTGVTGGLAGTLQVAVIAEHVARSRLGRARSVAASATIVSAALGPALYWGLLALGVSVERLLWGSAAAMVFATLLGVAATRACERRR